MVNASAVAVRKYQSPIVVPKIRTQHTLKYSIHARDIFHHITRHRVFFAEDLPRFLPHTFKDIRLARKHLETLAVEGDIDILKFDDPLQPQIYVMKDQGFSSAEKYMTHIHRTFPACRDVDSRDKDKHILHEALTTEMASRRHHFLLTTPGYKMRWSERFGLFEIPGFDDFIPDYADGFETPNGHLIDLVETLSGVRSITQVKRKFKKFEEWILSPKAEYFLKTAYRAWDANPDSTACRLLVTAHNRDIVGTDYSWEREILGATFDLHAEAQRRIWTVAISKLSETDNLDSPIWHCGTLLVKHRAAYKELSKRSRFAFLTNLLDDEKAFPKLPLFSVGQ